MRASGAGGMIGGQLLDLDGEGRPLGLAELERIHRAKTGALIRPSVDVGRARRGASPTSIRWPRSQRSARRSGWRFRSPTTCST